MWLLAEYRPVTLFSFRSVIATSSGAKTLLVPTPFAIRTALLDAAIRTKGLANGKAGFAWIKELSIAIIPPDRVVVANLFTKILKPLRKEEVEEAMNRTIAYREYAHLNGTLSIAFKVSESHAEELVSLLTQINHFGKRGSFFQLVPPVKILEELNKDFVSTDAPYVQGGEIKGSYPNEFKLGIIQVMDDWGSSLTFSKVDVYSPETIKKNTDRVRKNIILPYRLVCSSKSFTYYERI